MLSPGVTTTGLSLDRRREDVLDDDGWWYRTSLARRCCEAVEKSEDPESRGPGPAGCLPVPWSASVWTDRPGALRIAG
jgi:hypothetical protein